LIGSQNGTGESGSLHLKDLVDQDISKSTDFCLEPPASSEHHSLRVGPTVGEFGELKLNPQDTF
jgi:hypothetical protein